MGTEGQGTRASSERSQPHVVQGRANTLSIPFCTQTQGGDNGIERAGREGLQWPHSKSIKAERIPHELQANTGWGADLGGAAGQSWQWEVISRCTWWCWAQGQHCQESKWYEPSSAREQGLAARWALGSSLSICRLFN